MLLCSQSSDLSVVLHSGSYSVVFSCHYPDCTAPEATVVTNEWKEACYSLYKIYEAGVTKVVHFNVCITNETKKDLQSVQKTASDSLCLFQFEVFRKQELRFYSSQQRVFSHLLPPGGQMRLLQQHHPHQVSNITHIFDGGASALIMSVFWLMQQFYIFTPSKCLKEELL